MWRWPLTGEVSGLDEKHVPVAVCGYEELERWSRSLGQIHAFGIEGTGFLRCWARTLPDRQEPCGRRGQQAGPICPLSKREE